MMILLELSLRRVTGYTDSDIFGFWEFSTFFGTLFRFSTFFGIFLNF